jgi:hypothetical protein
MTTIVLKPSNYGFDNLIVNGRVVVSGPRIDAIENVGAGRWKGTAGGYAFELFGGRAAGGTSRDWFVRWDALSKDHTFHVNSAAAAVNLIQNA